MSHTSTTMSPPYRHLPTSITTSHSTDPAATTTTVHMPPIGTRTGHFHKDTYGWFDTREHTYVSALDALRLDGWVMTQRPTTGDIRIGTFWLTPPKNVQPENTGENHAEL